MHHPVLLLVPLLLRRKPSSLSLNLRFPTHTQTVTLKMERIYLLMRPSSTCLTNLMFSSNLENLLLFIPPRPLLRPLLLAALTLELILMALLLVQTMSTDILRLVFLTVRLVPLSLPRPPVQFQDSLATGLLLMGRIYPPLPAIVPYLRQIRHCFAMLLDKTFALRCSSNHGLPFAQLTLSARIPLGRAWQLLCSPRPRTRVIAPLALQVSPNMLSFSTPAQR